MHYSHPSLVALKTLLRENHAVTNPFGNWRGGIGDEIVGEQVRLANDIFLDYYGKRHLSTRLFDALNIMSLWSIGSPLRHREYPANVAYLPMLDAMYLIKIASVIDRIDNSAEGQQLLNRLPKDPVRISADERETPGRDAQFHLFVFAELIHAGIKGWLAEPDLLCSLGGVETGLACKRLKSDNKEETRLRSGAKQIVRAKRPGFVALEASIPAHFGSPPECESEEMESFLSDMGNRTIGIATDDTFTPPRNISTDYCYGALVWQSGVLIPLHEGKPSRKPIVWSTFITRPFIPDRDIRQRVVYEFNRIANLYWVPGTLRFPVPAHRGWIPPECR